jgi:hypothetical protein
MIWVLYKLIVLYKFALDDITRFIVSLLEKVWKLHVSLSEQSVYLSCNILLVFIEFIENIFSKSSIIHVWHQLRLINTDYLINFAFIKRFVYFCNDSFHLILEIFSDFLIKITVDRVAFVFNQIFSWKLERVNISKKNSFNIYVQVF